MELFKKFICKAISFAVALTFVSGTVAFAVEDDAAAAVSPETTASDNKESQTSQENQENQTSKESQGEQKSQAAQANRAAYEENREKSDLLEYMGIIPPNAKEKLSDRVTRGEFVEMLMKMHGFDGIKAAAKIFEDVDENSKYFDAVWAAYSVGIINGTADGKFYPNNFINYDEAIKMIVCTLELNEMAKLQGGYPMGYIRVANRLDILKNISSSEKTNFVMLTAIKLIFGTLGADSSEMTYSEDGPKITFGGDKTYLNERYDIYRSTGIVTGTERTLSYNDERGDYDGKIEISENLLTQSEDIIGYEEGLFGKSVYFYYKHIEETNTDEVIVIGERARRNNVLTVTGENISEMTESRVSYYDDKDNLKTVNVSGAKVYLNDVLGTDLSKYEINDDAVLTLIDNDGDRKYDYALLSVYGRIEVAKVGFMGNISAKYTNWSISKEESEDIPFYRDGIEVPAKFIGEWDILKFKTDRYGGIISVDVFFKEVTGEVESVRMSDKKCTIDGEVYKISDEYLAAVENRHFQGHKIERGLRATFVTDGCGTVYGVYGIESDKERYGYLVAMAKVGTGLDPKYQAKLVKMYGSLEYLDMPKEIKFNGRKVNAGIVRDTLTVGGVFKDQLVRYVINGKNELTEINTAIDATAVGMSADEFSLDYKYEDLTRKWTFNTTSRVLGSNADERFSYHIPTSGMIIPAFYIPKDLTNDGYFKFGDASSMMDDFAKDTMYYIYDSVKYTDDFELKYPSAIVIKEGANSTGSEGTAGPYSVSSCLTEYESIMVEEVVEELDHDGEAVKVLYGKTMNVWEGVSEFRGVFADTVWNADIENEMNHKYVYGTREPFTVDNLQKGDVIRIGYANKTASELKIDRFIVLASVTDAENDNYFTSYTGTNQTLTYVFGELVANEGGMIIVRTRDRERNISYVTIPIQGTSDGKVVYNFETDEVSNLNLAMITPGSVIGFYCNVEARSIHMYIK